MRTVSKLLVPLTLFLLAAYHVTQHGAYSLTQLTDPQKDGYSRLVRDIRNHPIARDKIPPRIHKRLSTANPADDVTLHGDDDDDDVMTSYVTLHHVNVISLESLHQVLEMSTYVSVAWTDTGLAWNSSQYEGVEMVELMLTDLWTPRLSVLNGVEDTDLNPSSSATPLFLTREGRARVSFSAHLKTSCPFNLKLFPFDTQTCELYFASVQIAGGHVAVLNEDRGYVLLNYSAGGEWTLTDVKAQKAGRLTAAGGNAARVDLTLRRKTVFYMMSSGIPMFLVSGMNCLVFLIPPESGEKVSFLVSLFVSNAVFSSYLNGILPRGINDGIPLISFLLSFMWLWSSVVILATIYVIRTFNEEEEKKRAQQLPDRCSRDDVTAAGSTSDPDDGQRRRKTSSENLATFLRSPTSLKQSQGKQLFVLSQPNRVAPLEDAGSSPYRPLDFAHSSTRCLSYEYGGGCSVGQTTDPISSLRTDGNTHFKWTSRRLDRLLFVLSSMTFLIVECGFCLVGINEYMS